MGVLFVFLVGKRRYDNMFRIQKLCDLKMKNKTPP
ncbi:hypothetical protein SAG0126_06430 [Streptococcus agalactiae STIR-CD-22]|nr:hypothetical protein SAG0126_06430 [Streptococcus agalactiae STIR-CD-22]